MSEFRQDLVSGDWIIIAPERKKRPHDFSLRKGKRQKPSPKNCPFEDLIKSGNWPPILSYPNEKNWKVILLPNKYPALIHQNKSCASRFNHGYYKIISGVGVHDLLLTRNHFKDLSELHSNDIFQGLRILKKRYKILSADKCLSYTSTFFNWGPTAGASLYHPHFQIITLPIIPPAVKLSLDGARRFFRKNKKCVHCFMIEQESKDKKRVILENSKAIAFAPFVSRVPFEIRIFLKKHFSHFEDTPDEDLKVFAWMLKTVLKKIKNKLNDPDYNFFIHTAPFKNREFYRYYHWHLEILPKITITAGFELSTGVDINVINPDDAAKILKAS